MLTTHPVNPNRSKPRKNIPVETQESDDDLPPSAGTDDEEVEEYEEFEIDPEDHVTLDALAKRYGMGSGGGPSLMTLSKNAGDEEMMGGMSGALPDDEEVDDGQPKTLADLIFAKIQEAESGSGGVVEGLRRRREAEAGELVSISGRVGKGC